MSSLDMHTCPLFVCALTLISSLRFHFISFCFPVGETITNSPRGEKKKTARKSIARIQSLAQAKRKLEHASPLMHILLLGSVRVCFDSWKQAEESRTNSSLSFSLKNHTYLIVVDIALPPPSSLAADINQPHSHY